MEWFSLGIGLICGGFIGAAIAYRDAGRDLDELGKSIDDLENAMKRERE